MSLSLAIDINKLKQLLDYSVKKDIEQYGKPAIIYNYHHTTNKLNTMDTSEQWYQEQLSLKAQGLTMKSVEQEINILDAKWNCILWVFQPLSKDNKTVDDKKYHKLTNHPLDPLGMAIDYIVSGFCYLELISKKAK